MSSMRKHYRQEARKHGLSSQSTMEDTIVRDREIELIQSAIRNSDSRVLDVGCGNGYALSVLSGKFPTMTFWGVDSSKDMLQLANSRGLRNCSFAHGDVRQLDFPKDYFDFEFSERCLINLADWKEQQHAIDAITHVLKTKGRFLLIECFTDGLTNLNRARVECGLPALKALPWNRYLDKQEFLRYIKNFNQLPSQTNFLSSHYFISRVLHPLVTKRKKLIRNAEFVRFFLYLPPIGNYSQLQAFLLEKIK